MSDGTSDDFATIAARFNAAVAELRRNNPRLRYRRATWLQGRYPRPRLRYLRY